MRFNLTNGLLTAALVVAFGSTLFATAAHAGDLVDQRGTAAPVVAQPVVVAATVLTPARGKVSGYVTSAGWDKPAPAPSSAKGVTPGLSGNDVALSDAIFRLIPDNQPTVVLDGPKDLLATPVTWSTGLSRRAALDEIAATFGLDIQFTGDKPGSRLVIQRTKAPAMSAGSTATASTTAVAVAVATTSAVAAVSPPVATSAPVMAAAVAAQPAAPAMHKYDVLLTDVKLSTTFARWAKEGNVRIRWDADQHLILSAADSFKAGSVLEAVERALSTPGIRNSDYPLEACEYPNSPPLIRITRQGEQAAECPQ